MLIVIVALKYERIIIIRVYRRTNTHTTAANTRTVRRTIAVGHGYTERTRGKTENDSVSLPRHTGGVLTSRARAAPVLRGSVRTACEGEVGDCARKV